MALDIRSYPTSMFSSFRNLIVMSALLPMSTVDRSIGVLKKYKVRPRRENTSDAKYSLEFGNKGELSLILTVRIVPSEYTNDERTPWTSCDRMSGSKARTPWSNRWR